MNEASSWVFFCVCVCERVPGRSADKARLLWMNFLKGSRVQGLFALCGAQERVGVPEPMIAGEESC